MSNPLHFETLKTKQRAIRHKFPETMGLRVHRAISWIGRSEMCQDDNDAAFIFLWISFNAAYADESNLQSAAVGERAAFTEYFGKLVSLDRENRIYDAIWTRFAGPIMVLMDNQYLFSRFWQHHNGVEGFADWEERFSASSKAFKNALSAGDCVRVLCFLFDRLYVLRNQIIHGGATWNSAVNRAQVRDGAAILGFLMPIFVDLMMDNPSHDWGRPFYPVVR